MSELQKAYSLDLIAHNNSGLVSVLVNHISKKINEDTKSIDYKSPADQYNYWKEYLYNQNHIDLNSFFHEVINRSVNIHNPGYMGHQIAIPLPITLLTSQLITYLNNGMGVFEMGMTGNSMEKVIIENVAANMGFNNKASGFVVTGGTIGNLTALLAARAAASNIWEAGNGDSKFAIMVSDQSHYSIDRAARIMGFGNDAIIKIPVDDTFKADCNSLQLLYDKAVKKGYKIFCCIGCACTTATGSYDDLDTMGEFCKKNNIWYHIDGAHGGAAIYSEKFKFLLKGIEKSDSVIIDFHKMMMVPSLSTALIFKNGSNSYHTFSQKADYLWKDQEDHEWYNSGMRTLECTKSMSVLNIFAIFKFYGQKIFGQNVDYLYGIAKSFHQLLKEDGNFEIPVEPESNILCFRYLLPKINANDLNNYLREQIVKDGEFYLVQTKLKENVYLRVSLMNPFTTEKELNKLIEKLKSLAKNYKP